MNKQQQREHDRYWGNVEHERKRTRAAYRRAHGQNMKARAKKNYIWNTTKHYEGWLASKKLYRAVKSGKITKPKTCSRCGRRGRIHGHHESYKKPLEVIWVCPLCHKAIHREKKARRAD